jgi:hypothetical protein
MRMDFGEDYVADFFEGGEGTRGLSGDEQPNVCRFSAPNQSERILFCVDQSTPIFEAQVCGKL